MTNEIAVSITEILADIQIIKQDVFQLYCFILAILAFLLLKLLLINR